MAWCRDLCDPAKQRIFPTYHALLHDHPFEKAGRLGTATNTALTNQLSLVTVGLRTLQMATVPVIVRPFYQSNSATFWGRRRLRPGNANDLLDSPPLAGFVSAGGAQTDDWPGQPSYQNYKLNQMSDGTVVLAD
jgi:hypothetical protein